MASTFVVVITVRYLETYPTNQIEISFQFIATQDIESKLRPKWKLV